MFLPGIVVLGLSPWVLVALWILVRPPLVERTEAQQDHARCRPVVLAAVEWTEDDRREVLRVRRVEFHNEPGTNWFLLIKQKYFDHGDGSRQHWKTKLNEAGWSGEQKP